MIRYLARSCPRCGAYAGITMRDPVRSAPIQALNGRCVGCSYRLVWIVIRASKKDRQRVDGSMREAESFDLFCAIGLSKFQGY
jgi:hypothetical protein